MTIFTATTEDFPTIERLARDIWPVAYGDILTPYQLQYMLDHFYSQDALLTQAAEKGHTFLVGTLDETPVGFASFGRESEPGLWKLHKLYLSARLQGTGLGKMLLHAVEEAVKSQGGDRLCLNVNRFNPAKRFYEKMGFGVTREEDVIIASGVVQEDFVMQKSL